MRFFYGIYLGFAQAFFFGRVVAKDISIACDLVLPPVIRLLSKLIFLSLVLAVITDKCCLILSKVNLVISNLAATCCLAALLD
jgi:hypothetical protein